MKLTNEYGNVTFEINDPREQERFKSLGYKEVKDKSKADDKSKAAGKVK